MTVHSVVFDNTWADWNEALPTGNGVFGGMVRLKDRIYSTAMNHYEVYYSILDQYAEEYCEEREADRKLPQCSARSFDEYVETARRNTRDSEKEAFRHYRKTIWPEADIVKQAELHQGQSHPPTGEFSLMFDETFSFDNFSLRLDIESARITMEAADRKRRMNVCTKTLTEQDMILTKVRQSEPGLLSGMEIIYPKRRGERKYKCQFFRADEHTFGYLAMFHPAGGNKGKEFHFCVLYRVSGAKAAAEENKGILKVRLTETEREVFILTHVLTELGAGESILQAAAMENIVHAEASLDMLEARHTEHWHLFFQRSSVQLPDRFLERLWFLNLYVLECSSGKGGRRYEQACGLNGLWDVRQPTLWGSMWYWDVNIQSAFWPVYASNHLELAEVFNNALLSYAEQARRRAEEFYHMPGYAADFPHEFYNCILPWCAQHLWWYYEYTRDTDFLRKKAYPFIKNVLLFLSCRTKNEEGESYIFPDVSPEQGPITADSVITLSCIRYLAEAGIRANEVLGEEKEDRELFSSVLDQIPKYPLAQSDRYGPFLRDSKLAPMQLHLRHPSLLMPIFPIGEFSQYSREKERKLAENSVRYAVENTERGVFQFGWLAAAAARTGQGNTALRVLYEQGLDLMLRANGMCAEETDRWMNHCLAELESGRIYSPFMMECVGGLLTAVDEMLLQDYDGVIHVFPAVPDGDEEKWRERFCQEPLTDREGKKEAAKWEDVSFSDFLARGGFEVSAKLRKGLVTEIRIRSRYGGPVKADISKMKGEVLVQEQDGREWAYRLEKGCLVFDTVKCGEYRIYSGNADRVSVPVSGPVLSARTGEGISYVGHLGRRVFCGKDQHTDVFKLLDDFLFDRYVADDRHCSFMAGKFNFGVSPEALREAVPEPVYEPQQKIEKSFVKITPDIRYCEELGLGFDLAAETRGYDSRRTNELVRDCVTGKEPARFFLELPKGIYEFLVFSGDGEHRYVTRIRTDAVCTEITAAEGRYGAGVFLAVSSGDRPVCIGIETDGENSWSVNLLVVKKLTSLL